MKLFSKFKQKTQRLRDGNTVYQSHLAKVKALKQQGITGWNAILQIVQDDELERNASDEQSVEHYNRVELAFVNLDAESKEALLALAEFIAKKRNVPERDFSNPNITLRNYNDDERACIGTAVQLMSKVRAAFGKNLRSSEFHPQGSTQWIING